MSAMKNGTGGTNAFAMITGAFTTIRRGMITAAAATDMVMDMETVMDVETEMEMIVTTGTVAETATTGKVAAKRTSNSAGSNAIAA